MAVIRGPELLVHRLVAVSRSRRWWLLKGDANPFCDTPVTSAGAILGRIEKIERDGVFVGVPPPPPEVRGARLLTGGTVTVLQLCPPAGVLMLRVVTTARRLLLRTYARLRRAEGPSPPATPS